MKSDRKLVIEFEPETLAEILVATHLCEVEISGLAKVKQEGDKFKVYGRVLIFDQECSLSRTEPNIETYGLWINNMVSSGEPEKIVEVSEQKLWWHSHVWHPVIFSGTDWGTFRILLSGLSEWWLALVANKRNELRLVLIEKNNGYTKYEEAPIILNPPISTEEFRELMNSKRDYVQEIINQKVSIIRS